MTYRHDTVKYKVQRKRKSKRKKISIGISCIMVIAVLIALLLFLKNLWICVETESFSFTESARELRNPNRGFYHLYTFWIKEKQENYDEMIETIYREAADAELILVKICLQDYRGGEISDTGLANIRKIFDDLESIDQQWIVRFIYDDEGKNEEYEPESVDIILRHMEQLQPILAAYSRRIFILQGLFTGNWGEMHGTRYDTTEDMKRLTEQLAAVTNSSVYLAVRTPAKWRDITQSVTPAQTILAGDPLAVRLSLFNDGLLGNSSDFGTYKIEDNEETDALGRWNREEELNFQEELCRYVPNGGEVINDNSYNDFENAVNGLAKRHITYLNKDYDQAVLDKWKKVTVAEEGCFQGMDGLTYMERHLGYRLLIVGTDLTYKKRQKCVSIEVALKNVGFAPIYKAPKMHIVFCNEEGETFLSKEVSCDIRSLTGGKEAGAVQAVYVEIPVQELEKEKYTVYFFMEDPDTGRHILLANEQEEETYGYRIGTVRRYGCFD